MNQNKTINIFGSTGSVGKKAFEIARLNHFEIVALTCNKNHDEIIQQAKICQPKHICVTNQQSFSIVKNALSKEKINIVDGSELKNIAKIKVDIGVMAIAGNPGIVPTFAMLGHVKRLAIATKEAIISGGELLIEQAKLLHTEIMPLDSEHNALFQCLHNENISDIEKLIITASGGPFLNFSERDLQNITPSDATANPNWSMGKKISIDSSTLINKAMEIIETAYLFSIPITKIVPLVHPESLIHAMAQFQDGILKATIYSPDMAFPISYGLNYPSRKPCSAKAIDFSELTNFSFKKPMDWQKRNMNLAYTAFADKKVIAFNAANTVAVHAFLNNQIKFLDIYNIVAKTLEFAKKETIASVQDIMEIITETNNQIVGNGLK